MSCPPVPPSRPMAAHVQAALGRGVQPKAAPSSPVRPLAPHVQAAIGRGVQPRMAPPSPPGAAHVQAALRTVVQGRPAPPVPPAPSRPGVVQRMDWQRSKGAIETTHKKHSLRWIWAPNLNLNIGGISIPPHEIHTKSVTPKKGTKGNKLWASFTLVWVQGEEIKQDTVVIQEGPVLGPVEAKLSPTGKSGHTEQQIGNEILEALEQALDAPVEEDLEAIIVEIHQTFTPCSGEVGCARYLENQIMDTINTDTRVPTLILRASAEQLYESQTVPTYPGLVSYKDREVIEDWADYGLEGEMVVVHNKVWK